METVNAYLFAALERHAGRPMQIAGNRTWTYGEAAEAAHGVARALVARGVAPGDRVALFADNGPRWIQAYLGILATGAVVVPRGMDTPPAELRALSEHSGSRVALLGTPRLEEALPRGVETLGLGEEDFPPPQPLEPGTLDRYAAAASEHDLAVLLYTSGTTGRPKGVMLEHRNLAHNLRTLPPMVDMGLGEIWVSVLPAWHTFEQTVELCGFSVGCITVYSSTRRLRLDLEKHRPHFFASVPRIWESFYESARSALEKRGKLSWSLFRAAFLASRARRRGNPLGIPLDWLGRKLFYKRIAAITGGRLKYAVSGGGALPAHVDEFFSVVGLNLLVGYGLTETSPVVALRDPGDNVLGTIGRPLPETEVRIGPKGTFLVRGPQVMRGYYRDEELTRAVLSEDGWFDTGDLGRLTGKGDLVFLGRCKETIVLSGGENVEPEPIEHRICESPLVSQAMLLGQDRKVLAALIVPSPDSSGTPRLEERIRAELKTRTGTAGGFRSFETVSRFALLKEPFTPANGLMTQTLKMKRNCICERYKGVIDSLYS